MTFREATLADIPALHHIRMSVKENILNNPALLTAADYTAFLTTKGKGWLCEMDGQIVGFAILDTVQQNIWALFVHPLAEGKGVGKQLQMLMLDWHFASSTATLWLGTAPGTKAERFYALTGWRNKGLKANGEVRFEMDYDTWMKH